MPGAVNIGSIKEVNTQVKGAVNSADRLGIINVTPTIGLAVQSEWPADGPAAQPQRADFDI